MKKRNSATKINRAYHARMKQLIKGERENGIFESLSAGKNSYLRMDRLASSSFDNSWIEVIEGVIFDLGDIIANPKLVTKTEGSLTPVELARKITSESVQHLANHSQYVKEIDEYGNVIPSKVLSMVSDDDLHTYENRFIATFVRRLLLFIEKRYEFVSQFADLRNEEVLFFKNKSIVDGAEVEIETKVKVSYKSDDEEALKSNDYIERIKETRRYILYFYNSAFMKALKNEKDVRNPILQTNIIRKNLKYNHCYNVYKFIENYDRLGVNYKIDESYSLFNNEEIRELNRTLFANYITLRGKDRSKDHKTVSKVYKPRILTSLDDESFIYGPLLEGPIEFVRTDPKYQEYLNSKIKKDLPLHPTKKEKEYYEDEYATKAEIKQDEKQKNDLIRRRQREVAAFEKQVRAILAKREDAREKLLALEQEIIKKEENDLLDAMRREIIAASLAELDEMYPKEEEPAEEPTVEEIEEAPVEEVVEEIEEEPVYEPTVTFEEAADEVWPQLSHPHPLPKQEPVRPKVEVSRVAKKVTPVVAPISETTSVKEELKPAPVIAPVQTQRNKIPGRFIVKTSNGYFVNENEYSIYKDDAKVFDDFNLANDIKKEKGGKVIKIGDADSAYVKETPQVSEPVETKVVEKPTEPAPVAPIKVEPVRNKIPGRFILKSGQGYYANEDNFVEDKDGAYIFDDYNLANDAKRKYGGKVIKLADEEVPAIEVAPVVEPIAPVPVINEPQRNKIPGRFIVKTPNCFYVAKNQYSPDKDDAYIFDDFNLANEVKKEYGGKVIKLTDEETPIVSAPAIQVAPVIETKEEPAATESKRNKIPGRFIVKTPNCYYVSKGNYSPDKDDAHIFDDFNLANDVKKVEGGKVIKLADDTPLKEEVKVEKKAPIKKVAPKKPATPRVKKESKPKSAPKKKAEPKPAPIKKEQAKPTPAPVQVQRAKIPGRFIVKTEKGFYVGNNKYSIDKDDAYVFDDFNLANDIKKEQGGRVIKL